MHIRMTAIKRKRSVRIYMYMQHYETNGNTSTQIRALETKKYTRPHCRRLHNITSLNIKMTINIRIIIKMMKTSSSS